MTAEINVIHETDMDYFCFSIREKRYHGNNRSHERLVDWTERMHVADNTQASPLVPVSAVFIVAAKTVAHGAVQIEENAAVLEPNKQKTKKNYESYSYVRVLVSYFKFNGLVVGQPLAGGAGPRRGTPTALGTACDVCNHWLRTEHRPPACGHIISRAVGPVRIIISNPQCMSFVRLAMTILGGDGGNDQDRLQRTAEVA